MRAQFLGKDPESNVGESPTLFATDRTDRKTYIAQGTLHFVSKSGLPIPLRMNRNLFGSFWLASQMTCPGCRIGYP